jgi:serine/threonine protein kinase/formylglycine-generating enzyme required for sulfatase activity
MVTINEDSRPGSADATLAEAPPSDVKPASGSPSTGGLDATIAETPADSTESKTLKTPEPDFGSTGGQVSPTHGAPPSSHEGSSNVLPSHKQKSSLGGHRSSLLQSGMSSGKEGEGELFDQGKYEIVKEIARGGMGAVYKARQRDLNRIVALKVMLSGAMASEGEKKRFLREAEASAKLKHPNIVPVYDIGEVDGNLYFTMDFVEGAPLSEKKQELTRDQLLDVMIKVCDAVAYAHMRGIIHRDLKPANVMMDRRGEPLIMDFGLAKETSTENESGDPDVRTREGSIMGTPHYMPPEQAEGQVSEIDLRSDVYALGVIVYELWTGQLPFTAKRIAELMRQVIELEPPSPRSIDASVPWEIEAIALKAMEKQKARRYDSALEMKRDLERFKSGESILARQASIVYRTRKSLYRNRFKIAGLAAVGAVAVSIGVAAYRQSTADRRARLDAAVETVRSAANVCAAESRSIASIPKELEEARKVPPERREPGLTKARDRVEKATKSLAGQRGRLDQISTEFLAEKDIGEPREVALRNVDLLLGNLHDWMGAVDKANSDLEDARRALDAVQDAAALLGKGELDEARKKTFLALQIGEEREVVTAKDLLKKILDAETAQARKKDGEAASKALDDGTKALEAARPGDPKLDFIERLKALQIALGFFDAGLARGQTASTDALNEKRDQAKLLYATTLLDMRAYALAFIEAQSLMGQKERPNTVKQAEALYREITRQRDDAQRAHDLLESAWDQRKTQPARALEKLKGDVLPRYEVLNADDRARFCTTLREAYANTLDPAGEDGSGEVDRKWTSAQEGVATIKVADPNDKSLTDLRATLVREHASFRLAVADRLKDTNPGIAVDFVKGAQTLGVPEDDRKRAADLQRDIELRLASPKDMERIPAVQKVHLGGPEETNPEHDAAIRSFYLGKHEVTSRDYLAFVSAGGYGEALAAACGGEADPKTFVDSTGRPGPAGWKEGKPREGTEDEPVTGVSFYEAKAYATWRAKKEGLPFRLPTDDEWEAAARLDPKTGTTRTFPWGDEWGKVGAKLAEAARARRGPSAVHGDGANLEDRSACGVYDMAGNVAEWVGPNDAAKADAVRGSVRGGSFLLPLESVSAAAHRATPRKTLRAEGVGFRIALDATAR